MNQSKGKSIKVHFVCTGVDRWRGGIETFFREAFDALQGLDGVEVELYKTDCAQRPNEHRVWSLYRGGRAAKWVGILLRRNPYIVEQMLFLPGYIRRIRASRPDLIFYSEQNLAWRLWKFRKWIGVPFKLLFSNGAPIEPPYEKMDHIQQVTPFYLEKARQTNTPDQMQSMVPYGIHVPAGDPLSDRSQIMRIRQELRLPTDRKIVLSVGWISSQHKRMDYLVREVAKLPEPRPFLALIGRMDSSSDAIVQLAKTELGDGNFLITSVPYEQVTQFYQAADVFALASLIEGFGRVYLEAAMHGLPIIAHDHPIPRFVLGDDGAYVDMSLPGKLADAIGATLARELMPEDRRRRREWVRAHFGWPALRGAYREMFLRCAGRNITP